MLKRFVLNFETKGDWSKSDRESVEGIVHSEIAGLDGLLFIEWGKPVLSFLSPGY
jgi:hypothetical protein